MNEEINKVRDMVKSHEGDGKLDKSVELNDTMTILATEPDEYEKTLQNLGGR